MITFEENQKPRILPTRIFLLEDSNIDNLEKRTNLRIAEIEKRFNGPVILNLRLLPNASGIHYMQIIAHIPKEKMSQTPRENIS